MGAYLVEDSMGYFIPYPDRQPRTCVSQKVSIKWFSEINSRRNPSTYPSLLLMIKDKFDGFVRELIF